MKKIFFALLLGVLFAPFLVHGDYSQDLEIIGIMYDPEGADSGREWVLVKNNSPQDIEVADIILVENDIHHVIESTDNEIIKPGQVFVIADKKEKVEKETGGYMVYDSAFSLRNTGEILALLLSDVVVDSVEYEPTSETSGTGDYLLKIDGVWAHSSASIDETKEEVIDVADDIFEKTILEPGVAVIVDHKKNTFVGTKIKFDVLIERKDDEGNISHDQTGLFLWNMGDGSVYEYERHQRPVYHIYRYPGIYTVVFEYYSSHISIDPIHRHIETVEVHSVDAKIIEKDGGLFLRNTGNTTIDISDWWVDHNSVLVKRFYKNSLLAAGQSIYIEDIQDYGMNYSLYDGAKAMISRCCKEESHKPALIEKIKDVEEKVTPPTITSEGEVQINLLEAKEKPSIQKGFPREILLVVLVLVFLLGYLSAPQILRFLYSLGLLQKNHDNS